MEKARERRHKNVGKNTGKQQKQTLKNSVFVSESKSGIKVSFQCVVSHKL